MGIPLGDESVNLFRAWRNGHMSLYLFCGRGLPIWTMLSVLKDLANDIKTLVLIVSRSRYFLGSFFALFQGDWSYGLSFYD